MTVNRNLKKSRPYDQPPKRRRSLIPGGPDSAATGFFVVAAVWLAVATGIGVLAIGMRLIPFELSVPLGLFDLSFELDGRRVEAAFVNATVFGWLSNAGFAAIAFMTPRLAGRQLAGERLVTLGMLAWNLALAGGIAGLYVFDLGPNAPLSAMLWLFDGGLAFGALIITGSFLATVGAGIRTAYVSTWFAGIALLSLLGMTGINATIGLAELFIELPELTVALISVFVERAITTLWLLGVAYATLHYVVPRATGQPLASAGLGLLAWVTWLAMAPLSALGALQDPIIPYLITLLGSVGTILLLVPAALTTVNLALSMRGRWSLLFGAGALAFAATALAFLLSVSMLEALGALRSVDASVSGTEWELGVFIWAAYGAFTMAAFSIAEHALPRILRRAWGGGVLASAQLWLAFGGATLAGLALMGGGLAEGSMLATGATPEDMDAALVLYRVPAFLGLGMVALAGLAMLVNLFLMYTSGEPADYTVPGQTATAAAGH
ncbi:MAG TPA: cbb3-type cytochrome c oxidase subunit I [Candidatus Limnocylindria bacterium]|nr:cbb3-type cytochrome c oxidase subunit I [Candidatus Limnocylindria bacterium]